MNVPETLILILAYILKYCPRTVVIVPVRIMIDQNVKTNKIMNGTKKTALVSV